MPIDTKDIVLPEDICSLVEYIAKNAHEVWAEKRMAEGWRFGPERDDRIKTHPGLVPYEQLAESEKLYDRAMAVGTLKAVMKLGYHIRKAD